MAKFCSNCGSPLNETDKVCGNCGTPVPGVAPTNPEATSATSKKEKGKNIIVLIAAAIILVVIIAVAGTIVSNNSGYRGAIKKMTKALQKYDMDTLEDLASSISDAEGDGTGDLSDYYADMVSDILNSYEDNVGPIKRITSEIIDVSEYSKRRVTEVEDNLVELYGDDIDRIKKILVVDLELTVKGKKETTTYYVGNLYMIKESDGWKIYYGNLDTYN